MTTVRSSDARIGVRLQTVWPGSACHALLQFEDQSAIRALATAWETHYFFSLSRVLPSMRVRHAADRPNKAPEPTPTSVTPRAIVRLIDRKTPTANRNVARGVPAVVVAHL